MWEAFAGVRPFAGDTIPGDRYRLWNVLSFCAWREMGGQRRSAAPELLASGA